MEEVWGEVVEEHGPAPTAAQARDVARRQTPAPPPLARKPRPKPATKTADRARDKVLELEQALERVDWPRVRQLRPDGWEGLLELRRIRDELDRLIAMLEPARDEVVVGGVLAEDVSDSPPTELDGIDDDGDTAAPGPRCAIFDVDPEDDWR